MLHQDLRQRWQHLTALLATDVILILSQDSWEVTTEEVQDWIERLGGESLRINGADLNGELPFALHQQSGSAVSARLTVAGHSIDANDVGAVWFRRWHTYADVTFLDVVENATLAHEMREHLVDELRAVSGSLEIQLEQAAWLSHPRERKVNKFAALMCAARVSLPIPATLITNDQQELQRFKMRCGRIITKTTGNGVAGSPV